MQIMNTKVLGSVLILLSLGIAGIQHPCYSRTAEQFRSYQKQQYWDRIHKDREIEQPLYKDYKERNESVTEKFVCIQPNENKHGYLHVIYTTGRIVKQYQTDNYMMYEGIKCNKKYDKYPNFKTEEQAKQYYKSLSK